MAVISLALALALGEGAARAFWWSRGEPYAASRTRRALAENLAAANGALIPGAARQSGATGNAFLHPYYGWEEDDAYARMDRLARVARNGLEADEYSVAIVGGSVSALFAEPPTGASDLLAAEIAADSRLGGRRVRILSQGRGAFKQPQQLFVIAWMLAIGIRPDAVINLDGFNELALANQNRDSDTHPLFPSFHRWGPRLPSMSSLDTTQADRVAVMRHEAIELARSALERHLDRSAILGPWALGRSTAAVEAWQSTGRRALQGRLRGDGGRDPSRILGPRFEGTQAEALDMAIATWRDCSIDLEALCRRRGIAYLHVLQPTLLDAGSKPLTKDEIRTGKAVNAWRSAVGYGYDKLRAEGAKLRAEGFPFLDASMVFSGVEQTLYYDSCHFEVEGNRILARAIAAGFRQLSLGG